MWAGKGTQCFDVVLDNWVHTIRLCNPRSDQASACAALRALRALRSCVAFRVLSCVALRCVALHVVRMRARRGGGWQATAEMGGEIKMQFAGFEGIAIDAHSVYHVVEDTGGDGRGLPRRENLWFFFTLSFGGQRLGAFARTALCPCSHKR